MRKFTDYLLAGFALIILFYAFQWALSQFP